MRLRDELLQTGNYGAQDAIIKELEAKIAEASQ